MARSYCNISIKDRVGRIGFGAMILIALTLSWPSESIAIIALVMIAEGFIGWCGFGTMVDMWQKGKSNTSGKFDS